MMKSEKKILLLDLKWTIREYKIIFLFFIIFFYLNIWDKKLFLLYIDLFKPVFFLEERENVPTFWASGNLNNNILSKIKKKTFL